MRGKQLLMLAALFFWGVAACAAEAEADPQAMVRHMAEYVLSQVKAHKAELEKDDSLIYQLVEEKVIPHFDFRRMTRSALGRYWRRATEDQRQRLTNAFREMLVRTYAVMLRSYSGQRLEFLPYRGKPEDRRAIVHIKVYTKDGAPPVPIDSRLYRGKDGEWRVYDVLVDGVSLIANYRRTFAREVRQGGIEGLIGSLEKHNQELRHG